LSAGEQLLVFNKIKYPFLKSFEEEKSSSQ